MIAPTSPATSARTWQREALRQFYTVLESGNALSRCCALKSMRRLAASDNESKKHLLALLHDPDPDVRTDAVAVAGELQIAEAVDILSKGLASDGEGEVRIEQARALARIRSADAVEALLCCVEAEGYPELDGPLDDLGYSPCWEVQSQSLRALGEIGDAKAADRVIAFLEKDVSPELQESGFKVLVQLDRPKAEAFLLRQITQGDPLSKRRAVQTLGWLAASQDEALGPKLTQALCNALTDPEPMVRICAAQTLGSSEEPMVLVSLTLLLNDPDAEVKKEVATILGGMSGSEVVTRLHDMLQESGPRLRRDIVRILGEIGKPESSDILAGYLMSEDNDLLFEVVRALRRIGKCAEQQRLTEILTGTEYHWTLRIETARALQHLLLNLEPAVDVEKVNDGPETNSVMEDEDKDCPDLQQALYSVLNDNDERLAYAALAALMEIEPEQNVELLLDLLRVENATPQTQDTGLEPTHPGESIDGNEELAELVRDKDPTTSTLAAILEQPVESDTEMLEEEVVEKEIKIRSDSLKVLAVRLLGGIANPGSEAVRVLTSLFESNKPELRREILLALGHIGGDEVRPLLLAGLEDPHQGIRLAALEAVESSAHIEFLQEALITLCRDPDVFIRRRAVEVLAKLATAADSICQALEDEDMEVCRTALRVLPQVTYKKGCYQRIVDLMFEFGGELRFEAAATLRRLKDFASTSQLLTILREPAQEEYHWICIDALGEMYRAEAKV
jgi:HEAT repeat protein